LSPKPFKISIGNVFYDQRITLIGNVFKYPKASSAHLGIQGHFFCAELIKQKGLRKKREEGDCVDSHPLLSFIICVSL
jgi:hypothetical protein